MSELQNELQGLDENVCQPLDSQAYAKLAENRSRRIDKQATTLKRATGRTATEVNRSLESQRRKPQALLR